MLKNMTEEIQKIAFVTGAAGQLGSALVEKLCSEGYSVHAYILSDHDDSLLVSLQGKGVVKIIKGDICNADSLLGIIPDRAIVFHCYSLSPGANAREEVYQAVNAGGTRNVLAEARRACVSQFVYASSCSVIGPKATQGHAISEGDNCDPNEPYGRSKLGAELEVRKFFDETKISTVICRIFPLYGPRAHKNSTPVRLLHLMSQKKFYMVGDGQNAYEFCFSRNAADGMVLASQKLFNDGGFEIVNTSEPIRRTYNEVIFEIAKQVNPSVQIVRIPVQLAKMIGYGGEMAFKLFRKRTITRLRTVQGLLGGWTSDCSKVVMLGYSQKYSLEEGVAEVVMWARKNGHLDDKKE